MKKHAIIVAGGSGTRMGKTISKQFLEIKGKPTLMRTIEQFVLFDNTMDVMVVLPESQIEYWKELCNTYNFTTPHTIAPGGESRFHSVKNGLDKIDNAETGIVAVHDGVRPFPSLEMLHRCFNAAEEGKSAVPVLPVVESLRQESKGNNRAVKRSEYFSVQTPQTFPLSVLKMAYTVPFSDFFTDDASVVEYSGETITLVEGNKENIKITHPIDLVIAEHYVKEGFR